MENNDGRGEWEEFGIGSGHFFLSNFKMDGELVLIENIQTNKYDM